MTLAGMTLAIGPMIDTSIICLENTHRHLGMGVTPREAAFLGTSEVAMPELVSTLCTFLVLSPLVLTPGLGQFLFKPMAMAVAFAMIAAYFLSRTLVPACRAYWLKPHAGHGGGDHGEAAGDQVGGRPLGCERSQGAGIHGGREVSDQWQRPTAAGNMKPGLPSLGADDRDRDRILRQGPRRRPAAPHPRPLPSASACWR